MLTMRDILAHQTFLATIQPEVETYQSCEAVAKYAGRLTIAAIIGPAGIGKNTLMNQVKDEPKLHIATAVTSREKRESDTIYRRYYDFSTKRDQTAVRSRLDEGRYIQVASHPATGEIYATEQDDFHAYRTNLMDITAAEYVKMQNQGVFGCITPICIVTPTYDQWQRQWLGREQPTQKEYLGRMQEARDSLAYCLGNSSVRYVINGYIPTSARRLTEAAHGVGEACSSVYQELAYMYAQALVEGIDASGVLRQRGSTFQGLA